MWTQLITVALGISLMAAPSVLGYDNPAGANDHIVGPLIASIAVSEATRPLRWLNVLLGFWLLVAPLVLGYGPAVTWHSLAIGAAVVVLAAIPVQITQRVGGGWSALWRSEQPADEQ